jgi:hypothetical protein
MRAFIPRAIGANRQTIGYQTFPRANGTPLPDGAEIRQAPVIHCGGLPDGSEIRQAPIVICGSLPDGTELRQFPVVFCG